MSMATHSGSMEFRTLVSKLRYTEECSPQSGTLQSRTQTLGKWNIRKKVACSLYFLLYTWFIIMQYLRLKYVLYSYRVVMKTTYALRSYLEYVLSNYISCMTLRSGFRYVLSNYMFCKILRFIYILYLGLEYVLYNL